MKPDVSLARRALPRVAGAFFVAGALSLVLMACGISFGASEDESELLQSVSISGDFVPRGRLTLLVEYTQQYPVEVRIRCTLIDPDAPVIETQEPTPGPTPTLAIPALLPTPHGSVTRIYTEEIPPNPDGGPVGEATPVAGSFEHVFAAPEEPGLYVVRCFTPEDDNNRLSTEIVIHADTTPTP